VEIAASYSDASTGFGVNTEAHGPFMAGPSSPIFGLSPVSPGGVLTATASVRKLGDVYQIERAAQSVPSHEVSCCRYRCS